MSILLSLFIVAVIALDKAIVSSYNECGENQVKSCDFDCIEPSCANRISKPIYFCNLRPSAKKIYRNSCIQKCQCERGYLRDLTTNECVAPSQCPALPYDNTQLAGPDVPGRMGISVYNAVQRIIDEHEDEADNELQNDLFKLQRDNPYAGDVSFEEVRRNHEIWSDSSLYSKMHEYYEQLEMLENKNQYLYRNYKKPSFAL